MLIRRSEAVRLVFGALALAAFTVGYRAWSVSNPTIVALTFLLVVLVVAAQGTRWVGVAIALLAMLAFNYFFLPPVGRLTIADPQNWIALFTFLAVSLVASHLSAVAKERTQEAVVRRDELARLFDLSRDVLIITEGREALSVLTRSIARRFDLEFVAIALPANGQWDVVEAGAVSVNLAPGQLSEVFAAAQASLEFDAHARTYAGHRTLDIDGRVVRLVPLRVGTTPRGLLAAAGRPIEAGTLDALGGVVALAIERTQFLEERKAGELARQSDELKTALLASLGHDMRTPLTAIRIAAANIQTPSVSEAERQEQCDLILAESERLTRLFQNILEMARIDAGAVSAEFRWAQPSEIVAAARDQVEQMLRGHPLSVQVDDDGLVRLDPRLTASALAHLLENAAQYSPAGSAITLQASANQEGLEASVRDHGPGIAPADLPRVFGRFFRGSAAGARSAGTGMGLWIARGLLAAERGRVWAENCPDGGARFTIKVPAAPEAEVTASPAT